MTQEIAIDFKPSHPVVLEIRTAELDVRIDDPTPLSVHFQEVMRGLQGIQGLPGSVDSVSILVGQVLQAGAFVNVYDDGGIFKVRPATSHLAGREANGYVLLGYALGEQAIVYFNGTNTALSALIPGVKYLGVNGVVSDTPAEGTGVVQIIGTAVAADKLHFQPSFPVVLFGTPT